jgi:hypothetical protein
MKHHEKRKQYNYLVNVSPTLPDSKYSTNLYIFVSRLGTFIVHDVGKKVTTIVNGGAATSYLFTRQEPDILNARVTHLCPSIGVYNSSCFTYGRVEQTPKCRN